MERKKVRTHTECLLEKILCLFKLPLLIEAAALVHQS